MKNKKNYHIDDGKIKIFSITGFPLFGIIITIIIIIFISACIETNIDQENESESLLHNSSNNASNLIDDVNNTTNPDKTQSGPISIPLEKPPFIN